MMEIPQRIYFDPLWRDDIYDSKAIDMPLALPDATPSNSDVWVEKKEIWDEVIFENKHTYEVPRFITAVLKPSDMSQHYSLKDSQGNTVLDDAISSMMFPAKAWMSDSAEERCMMYAGAREARGHILVGGLGLGIYPQFVLALNRPVKSITIIEQNKNIIDFVKGAWLNHISNEAIKITIIEDTIENYLSQTKQKFDTIYLDTWEDADPRFLAHINYLIALASNRCAKDATIQCWGYSKMIDTFVENVKDLTKNEFPLKEYNLDPVLQGYVDWLTKQEDNISEDSIGEKAKICALAIQQSIEKYDRNQCFTGFSTSRADFYRNLALSRK